MKRFLIVLCVLTVLILSLALPVSALGVNVDGVRDYYNYFDYVRYIDMAIEGEGTADEVYKWTYTVGNTVYPLNVTSNGDGSLLSFAKVSDGYPQVPANTVLTSLPFGSFRQIFKFFAPGDIFYLNYGTIGTTFKVQYMQGDGSWIDLPVNTPITLTEDILRANVRFIAKFNWEGQSNVFSPGAYRLYDGSWYDPQYVGTANVDYAKSIFVPYNITAADYDTPYNNGYQNGLRDGLAEKDQAYKDGVVAGRAQGIAEGKAQGIEEASEYSFFSLMNAVVSVPIQAFTALLNFDIFGYNMLTFFGSVVTLILCVWVIRTFLL